MNVIYDYLFSSSDLEFLFFEYYGLDFCVYVFKIIYDQ